MVMSPGVAAPAEIWSCDGGGIQFVVEGQVRVVIVVILHHIIKNSRHVVPL